MFLATCQRRSCLPHLIVSFPSGVIRMNFELSRGNHVPSLGVGEQSESLLTERRFPL